MSLLPKKKLATCPVNLRGIRLFGASFRELCSFKNRARPCAAASFGGVLDVANLAYQPGIDG
jgi:hypothetical protein